MASPVSYDFEPNVVVWHITDDCGVKKATVLRVDIVVDTTATVITYRIRYFDDNETVDATENLYAEADIATAMTDYEAMLIA